MTETHVRKKKEEEEKNTTKRIQHYAPLFSNGTGRYRSEDAIQETKKKEIAFAGVSLTRQSLEKPRVTERVRLREVVVKCMP